MFDTWKLRFKEWLRKRKWNARLQLYHFHMQIIEDQRWLAMVPNVMSTLESYLDIIKNNANKIPPKQTIIQLTQCIKNDFDFSEIGYHPVYSELFKRYSNMLADNWEQIANREISKFRDEIGCNPMRITAECFDTNSLINNYNNKLMQCFLKFVNY